MARLSRAAVCVMAGFTFHIMVLGAQYLMDKNKALVDKGLTGYAFLNLTTSSVGECFSHCITDCRCMTVQVCENTKCQLLSSNQFQDPTSLIPMQGCSYYDIIIREQDGNLCHSQWTTCCQYSNPCLNGGTCEPSLGSIHKKRFTCKCAPGYGGELCELNGTSCRVYKNGNRVPGKYKTVDNQLNVFEVFCDFDVNSEMSWTLIQSYQLQYTNDYTGHSLGADKPVNENNPNWENYRLSRSKMNSIQKDSTKWRVTCRYDTDGLVYTDYIQGSNEKLDILTYRADECREVEYIDVRGTKCTSQSPPCTAMLYQADNEIIHHDSNVNCRYHSVDQPPCGGDEDNFGYYRCPNPAHRCSATPTSTTQTWFGGD